MQSATRKACIYSFVAICIFLILIFGCEREKLFELKLSTSEEHDVISQKSLELSGQSYFDRMRNVEGVNVREWRGDTIVYAEGKLKIRLHKGVSPQETMKYVAEFDPVYDQFFDKLGWGFFSLPNKDSLFPLIERLDNNPSFDIVGPVYVGTVASEPSDPYYELQWHLKNTGQAPTYGTPGADINAEQAWQITTGSPDVGYSGS